MPIDPSLERSAFEPEAIAAMGEAFDTACKELHCAGQPEVVRELIAKRSIASASKGELDPACLRAAALSGFPLTQNVARSLARSARNQDDLPLE